MAAIGKTSTTVANQMTTVSLLQAGGLNGEKGNFGAMEYERDDCDRESDEPLLTECSGGAA